MLLVAHLDEYRLRDVVVAPPVGGSLGVGELVKVVAAGLLGDQLGLGVDLTRLSTKWQRPPCDSINTTLDALVDAGITAMNGRPNSAAKYASDTAVEPEDASTTVVPSPIQPLHSA